jgi:hypothetical protein
VLKECFESQDIEKLQQTIREMPEEDAKLHMKRAVASGLWKPAENDPDTNPEDGFKRKEDGEEDTYAEAGGLLGNAGAGAADLMEGTGDLMQGGAGAGEPSK